jgi:hypothetical protein
MTVMKMDAHTPEFRPWPKTPRLFKNTTITEKIDGTNGAIHVTEDGEVFAQSRNRMLSVVAGVDNAGFAAWAYNNSSALAETLGVGTHFGEWWGHGINRGYGCAPGERYFSLFNTDKWGHLWGSSPLDSLSVVPVLWSGTMDTAAVVDVARKLRADGSKAKPGFMRPEGLCLFHSASNQIFKYPFDKDDKPSPAWWNDRLSEPAIPRPKTFKDRVKEMFWLVA